MKSLLLIALLVPFEASAEATKSDGCWQKAQFLKTIAQARDKGISSEAVTDAIMNVTAPSARQSMRDQVTYVYELHDLSPEGFMTSTYRGCMGYKHHLSGH